MNAYLDLARQGKTGWRCFVLAVALILFLWQILGALPSVFLFILVLADGNPQTDLSPAGQFVGVEPILSFAMPMLASVLFLVGIFLAIRLIHQRPFRTLITPARLISWGRFFQGFAVWFVLSGLMSLAEALLYPGRYVWTLDLRRYIPFVFLALILIPIQTSAEELFFRGYILQNVGLRLRNVWILSAISGFLFMVPHFLNPEARVNYGLMGFYYFFIGAGMAYITLRDGRLELALGLHAANNLFSALFANYTVTVMPTPSLFTVNTLDAVYSVSAAVIGLIVFVLIFVGPFRRRLPDEDLVG
ncbi:MAG: CPBP family intramembrane metalloprotease [Chloroflexi bacterium]|nr:CPBP family intramembrane metalloprotease [Chloroflexota bacterium]